MQFFLEFRASRQLFSLEHFHPVVSEEQVQSEEDAVAYSDAAAVHDEPVKRNLHTHDSKLY